MVNSDFYNWLTTVATSADFETTVPLTETAKSQQKHLELALRLVAYRRTPYSPSLDVNEYLDKAALRLAHLTPAERETEDATIRRTMGVLAQALGADAFKRWDGGRHTGGFLISGFDAIAHGVASNIEAIRALDTPTDWVREKARGVWLEEAFRQNSGMGVRGTTRLSNLLPFGEQFFRP